MSVPKDLLASNVPSLPDGVLRQHIANLITVVKSTAADASLIAQATKDLQRFKGAGYPAVDAYFAEVALSVHRAHVDDDDLRYS